MQKRKSKNRVKHLLLVHIIFSVKYRKKLAEKYSKDIKYQILKTASISRFEIDSMEIDKDHIHLLVRYEPNISISQIVRKLKSESTYHLWREYSHELQRYFWKKHIFWTPGYFVCSIGDANQATIKRYIETQG